MGDVGSAVGIFDASEIASGSTTAASGTAGEPFVDTAVGVALQRQSKRVV